MNEVTEHIYPTTGRHVDGYSSPVLTGCAREEVVRCPACKHPIWEDMQGEYAYCCAFRGWYACEDGFCHLAEVRDE